MVGRLGKRTVLSGSRECLRNHSAGFIDGLVAMDKVRDGSSRNESRCRCCGRHASDHACASSADREVDSRIQPVGLCSLGLTLYRYYNKVAIFVHAHHNSVGAAVVHHLDARIHFDLGIFLHKCIWILVLGQLLHHVVLVSGWTE